MSQQPQVLTKVFLLFKHYPLNEDYQKKATQFAKIGSKAYFFLQALTYLTIGIVHEVLARCDPNNNESSLLYTFVCAFGTLNSAGVVIFHDRKYCLTQIFIVINSILISSALYELLLLRGSAENLLEFDDGDIFAVTTGSISFGVYLLVNNFFISCWVLRALLLFLCSNTIMSLLVARTSFAQAVIFIQIFETGLCITSIYYYLDEKTRKLSFYKQHTQDKSLAQWETIIDKLISLPIMICQQDNTENYFLNQKFEQEFKMESDNSMKQKMRLRELFEKLSIYNNYQQLLDNINTIQKPNSLYNLIKLEVQESFIPKEIRDQQDSDQSIQSFAVLRKTNQNVQHQFYAISDKEKMRKFYEIKFDKIFWNDEKSTMCIFEDVTDKVMYSEKLRNINKYKDSLLASVTHDLKTPLNGIILYTQMSDYSLIVKQYSSIKENLDIIYKNCIYLQSLISDILDFSQLKSSQLKLNCTSFSLQELILDMKQLFEQQVKEKNLSLQFIYDEQDEHCKMVYNDKQRIKQILINLISNALKYTFQGKITGKFTRIYDENDDKMEISVEDTGVGIPIGIQNNLFQEYATYDHYEGSNKNGIGLGLCICQKLCQLIGPQQSITVQSEVNQGSKFIFQIYTKQQIQKPSKSEFYNIKGQIQLASTTTDDLSEKSSINNVKTQDALYLLTSLQSKKKFGSRKILIADDMIYNIMGLKGLLGQILDEKVNVFHTCFNGSQACALIDQMIANDEQPYDLIFMDIDMPIMNGIEAVVQIKQKINHLDKYKKKIKIIFCSAYESEEQARFCIKIGGDYYATKPLGRGKLIEILKLYTQ